MSSIPQTPREVISSIQLPPKHQLQSQAFTAQAGGENIKALLDVLEANGKQFIRCRRQNDPVDCSRLSSLLQRNVQDSGVVVVNAIKPISESRFERFQQLLPFRSSRPYSPQDCVAFQVDFFSREGILQSTVSWGIKA